MQDRMKSCLSLLLLSGLLVQLLLVTEASAIPAFTRAYKAECATCHTIFPELTEQGDAFMKNSFVWVETKASDGKEDSTAVDPFLRPNAKPYLLLSTLPEYIPLSVLGTLNASYNDQATPGNKFDLSTRALVLEAGGNLGEKLGFYARYNAFTEGFFDADNANAPGNNTPNLVELFGQARHVFDTPINVKFGRMTPELSLWKGFDKTGVSTMATLGYRVGNSQFFIDAPTDGVELNTVVNGRVFVAGGTAKRKNQDKMEGFGSVAVKIGGSDFEGREAVMDLDNDSIFDYLILTFGGYGYVGSNQQGPLKAVNDFYRYGLESSIRYQRLRMKLATAFGRDDNPFFQTAEHKVKSSVYAAEALYLVTTRVIPSIRYEYEDAGNGITQRIIPVMAYAPLQNAKLTLEYKYQTGGGPTSNVATLGAEISF